MRCADHLSIAGSSTVYPFSTVVAERIGKAEIQNPKGRINRHGRGGGIKLFCEGIGVAYPDMANTYRKMQKSEFDACQKTGITEIAEVKIGFDGIILAYSKESKFKYNLTLKEI